MTIRPCGELLPGHDLVQVFRVSGAHSVVISLRLATYLRTIDGQVTLALHRLGASADGDHGKPVLGGLIAEMVLVGAAIENNETVELFADGSALAGVTLLALRVQAKGTRPGSAPTAWLSDDQRLPGHVACFLGDEDLGAFGLYGGVFENSVAAPTSVPVGILYSPVTQCNLNCIHCISRDTRTRATRLSADIKARIRGWAEQGKLLAVENDYSGDILWAEAKFGGELQFLIDLSIQIRISTNGAFLTEDIIERLCGAKIFAINISLDAAEEETYRRVRKGAPPLREVCGNIAAMVRARARHKAGFGISMSFTLMRSTLREWPAFLRLASRLGVETVLTRHLEAFRADMEADSLWHDREGFNQARLEAVALAEELGIALGAPPPFGTRLQAGHRLCIVPWVNAAVLGNGDVLACCVPGLKMGNLHEASMEEIWDGPAYRALRASVNSPTPPKPCAACPIFRYTDNPDSYLIHSAMQRRRRESTCGQPASPRRWRPS